MSTIPVLEEEHFSAQGGDGIQDHGRVTGIGGGGGLGIRLSRIRVGVWTWRSHKLTSSEIVEELFVSRI